jgi:hypothetical protein
MRATLAEVRISWLVAARRIKDHPIALICQKQAKV